MKVKLAVMIGGMITSYLSFKRISSPNHDKVVTDEIDEKQASDKHTVTFADDLVDTSEDGQMLDDYEDSTFPIINLLPKLISDLAA